MIRPIRIDKQSVFLGQQCALCKDPFAPGDEVVICPEDGSRHHSQCWQANGSHCAAFGCEGEGELPTSGRVVSGRPRNGRSKVIVRPGTNFGCGGNCLLLSIAFAIVVIALSCFGLWAMLDYVFMEKLHWFYREPLTGLLWYIWVIG